MGSRGSDRTCNSLGHERAPAMDYPILLGTACVGLVLISFAWCGLLLQTKRGILPLLLGPAGTLIAAIPILGVWMPGTFQPIWHVVQVTFSLWLLSFALIVVAMVCAFGVEATKRERIAAVVCGGPGFLLNAAAFLPFLAYATTSAGGV